MQLCCVKTLQQYELLRNSRRVGLSLTAVCDRICAEVLGGGGGATVFSVALLCHSNAALNRIEAFWDSDLIVPNCIVPTLRCIDD